MAKKVMKGMLESVASSPKIKNNAFVHWSETQDEVRRSDGGPRSISVILYKPVRLGSH